MEWNPFYWQNFNIRTRRISNGKQFDNIIWYTISIFQRVRESGSDIVWKEAANTNWVISFGNWLEPNTAVAVSGRRSGTRRGDRRPLHAVRLQPKRRTRGRDEWRVERDAGDAAVRLLAAGVRAVRYDGVVSGRRVCRLGVRRLFPREALRKRLRVSDKPTLYAKISHCSNFFIEALSLSCFLVSKQQI